jgi:hypothetical protein
MMIARRLLAIAWVVVAVVLLVEVLEHALGGTSDITSQTFRILFIGLYIAAAAGLWLQGKYSAIIVIVASLLAGIRSYFVLAIPKVIVWTYANEVCLVVVMLAALSIPIAIARWRRDFVEH